MEKDNKKFKNIVLLILIAAISFWIVNNLSIVGNAFNIIFDIVFPFILGGCVAFILNLPMSFFEGKLLKLKNKKGKQILGQKFVRILSLILAVIVIIFVLTLIIDLVLPELINVAKIFVDNVPYYAMALKDLAKDMPNLEEIVKETNLNLESLKTELLEKVPNLVSSSISVITGLFSGITSFIISIIFAVYILTGKEKIAMQTKKIILAYFSKEKAEKIFNFGNIANKTFSNFFTVQCLEAAILGALCMIGMLVLKIPYAGTIGILIGVTALIPLVGAFIGVIIGAILIASVDIIKVITFVIFVLLLQQFEGNVIYPRVVGSQVGLPGMWVLVAVSVGGSLFGIPGMLLGVPCTSVIYTLFKNDVDKKISEKHIKV